MPGFADPLWLVGLGIIPLIRWLHRAEAPLSAWQVSALFLWDQASEKDAQGKTKKRPDPAWRRRALLAAFVVGALANPHWMAETRLLTVWVDNSLSMQAMENGSTRLSTLMTMLAKELNQADSSWDEVVLRSLSDPGEVSTVSSSNFAAANEWQSWQVAEPVGPPAPLMSERSNHWLLTDGASEALQSWAQRVRIDHALQTGAATENVAVSRLAARRNLEAENTLDVLVAISNTGRDAAERRLSLYSGGRLLEFADLSLAAGQTLNWQSRILAGDALLKVALTSGDVLSADDELTLDLSSFEALATVVEDACGPALRRAVVTHPSLRLAGPADRPALAISCSHDRFPAAEFAAANNVPAHIRMLSGSPASVATSPVWTPYAGDRGNLLLAAEWLSAAAWPAGADALAAASILLRAEDMPLVVLRTADSPSDFGDRSARFVDTSIDLRQPLFVQQPEFAAFVAVLADIATDRQLLTEPASVSRHVQASRVSPVSLDVAAADAESQQRIAAAPLSSAFVILALLLLLLDTTLYLRSRRSAKRA